MNRAGYLLLTLLLAQLAWWAYLEGQERAAGGANVSARLADTGPFHIDELRLEDARGNRVTLRREAASWVLPAAGNLPADGERVAALLERLTAQDPGWAVAHSLAARQRFRVADYHFRRRIDLLAQDAPVATVYLGTSPGFRKVHARNAASDAIYSIRLNLFDLPAIGGRWLAPDLLQLKSPLRISADGYSLDRSSGQWLFGDGARPESGAVTALVDALQELQVSGLPDAALTERAGDEEATLILQVESLSGSDTLSLYRLDEQYLLHSSRRQRHFLISAYTYDTLTGIDAVLMSAATDGD